MYGDETVAYLTIKLNRDGFVLFKKFRGNWWWTFNLFPGDVLRFDVVGDETWAEHSLYPEFQKLLRKLSKENGGIQEFRADLYITELSSELKGKDSLQILSTGDRK